MRDNSPGQWIVSLDIKSSTLLLAFSHSPFSASCLLQLMAKQKTRITSPTNRRPRSKSKPLNPAKAPRMQGFPLRQLPVDVGFEIFSHLSPRDLLSLTEVNTEIRSILLAPNTAGVWRSARQRCYEDAPAPIEEISEQRWARLLFDEEKKCEVCGILGCGKRELAIQKRICFHCVAETGIKCEDITAWYPGVETSVLEVVPRLSGATAEYEFCDFYPKQELDTIIATFRALNHVDAKRDFLATRRQFLLRVKEVSKEIRNWWLREEARRSDANKALRDERLSSVKHRLVDAGYTQADVDCWEISQLPCVNRPASLTDRSWDLIKNQVIDTVNRRKLRGQKDLLNARNEMITRAFHNFKRSVPGSTWRTFPSIHVIGFLDPVHHLKVSQDTSITEEDFRTTMETDLRLSMERWTKKQTRSILLRSGHYRHNPGYWRQIGSKLYPQAQRYLNKAEVPDFVLDSLFDTDLAVVEIRCSWCKKICYGINAAIRHLHSDSCSRWKPDKLEAPRKNFEPVYVSWVAAACVVCDGLDPWSATADDMDERNSVYECRQCTFRGTWRALAAHASAADHDRFALRVSRAVSCDQSILNERVWSCNHCHEHLNGLVSRNEAVTHLKLWHDVWLPKVPRDFFYGAN
ncbi:hypothetical protein VNI00_003750 [Paramarasmius palmivorus]|uniref:F-box domain-containing protein n=1 Tax=Paramarasmius palmivorus TaxID=297713 RepID=A0AAW0DUG2_9AGAR